MISKILLLEVNEVPIEVIDKYKNQIKYKGISKFFNEADNYESFCVDKKGMLDPWLIWPTIHRGVDYKTHNIKNLGQDPKTFNGTPIWQEFIDAGYNVGIFGSLQSWPPINPGENGFYIPDTFAHDEQCIPNEINFFQKINLDIVSKNGRQIDKKSIFSLKNFLGFFKLLKYISIKTIFRIFFQLLMEKIDNRYYARRPTFQTIICWDIFKKLYKKNKLPYFSTFFTNHIANLMHRYWTHLFDTSNNKNHKPTFDFALKILDEILLDTFNFQSSDKKLKVFFISGMGQEAIVYDNHEGFEAVIHSINDLMSSIGIKESEFKPLLAMVPQVAISVPSIQTREKIVSIINSAKTFSNKKIFSVLEEGKSLSITIITPTSEDIAKGEFRISLKDKDNIKLKFIDSGIEFITVEPGEAYHKPEGILSIINSDFNYNRIIKTDEIKAIILKESNIH